MLKSVEYIGQISGQINDKLIMNPLQLLVYQLQAKQISSKKQSIQSLHVIALTMKQKQIINQLFPFLIKTLIEQNSKQIKISIIKSFRSILQLLSKQKSYLKFLQMLLDIFIVFEEPQIKSQTLSILNVVLFESNVLKFQSFKQIFKNLALCELKYISEASSSKNAKQLSLYLIKYLLKNWKLLGQVQTKEIIQFLKANFLFISSTNDYTNIRILSQNFNILTQQWPQTQLNELNFCIDSLTGQDIKKQEQTQKVQQLNSESQKNIQQKQVSIINKNNQLPKQVSSQIKSNIIPALIIYAKRFDIKKSLLVIQRLLKQQDPKIKISLIKKTKQIFSTFINQNIQSFLSLFKNFTDQTQDVKKSILEVIDDIDINQDDKKDSIIQNSKNAMELKNILIQSLIKSNKSQTVGQILNQSDYDFKIKIFIKLPDSLLHQNILYSQIVDSLLSQPKKNFRSKLNIVLNLISRIQDNAQKLKNIKLIQTVDISYLLLTLIKYFGDKIAIIRVNIAKLFSLILYYYDIQALIYIKTLEDSFYGQKKSWFERQNVLIMIKQYLQIHSKQQIKTVKYPLQNNFTLKNKNSQFYTFMIKILSDAKVKTFKKDSSNQSQKVLIQNITGLSQEIILKYSLQI